jgi:hypothetical protein
VDKTFDLMLNNPINDIALEVDGSMIIGGQFSSVGEINQGYLARISADGNLDVDFDPVIKPSFSPVERILILSNGDLIIGGSMAVIDGQSVGSLARLKTNGDLGSQNGLNGFFAVRSLVPALNGGFYRGGLGSPGTSRQNIVKHADSGVDDDSFEHEEILNSVLPGGINDIAFEQDGSVILVGNFSFVNGIRRHNIARVDANGDIDLSFAPEGIQVIRQALVMENGKILLREESGRRLLRLNSDGAIDTSFEFYRLLPWGVFQTGRRILGRSK